MLRKGRRIGKIEKLKINYSNGNIKFKPNEHSYEDNNMLFFNNFKMKKGILRHLNSR